MQYLDVLGRHLVIENERIEVHLPFEFFPQVGKYKLLEILRNLVTTNEFQIILWEKLHKTDFDKSIFVFISPENISIVQNISMQKEIIIYSNYNAIVDIRDIDEEGELCDGEQENIVYDIQEHVKDSIKEALKMFEEEIIYKAFYEEEDEED